MIGNWLLGITDNKYLFLLMVNLIILILGMFVDTSVIQLVMIPILWPVAQVLGINIIHFGLVIVFNMMVGLSTPPFGMCLFITSGISGTPLKDVIKEIKWPIVVMLIVLTIITYIPDVVLFLPRMFHML
ncbi:C4-dicarboxylate TRAP transporter large permease protein DctM [bioreactor metagenome]|uniref:C4-dicarboxylate TRAP transporter large permease protein DctM n=1 Tax=bioreactor metagenome TaxID=1076179 RepID=A0A645EEA5_9ZZZZ